jgi:diguanylate cyclase (GGDEF)-like protein
MLVKFIPKIVHSGDTLRLSPLLRYLRNVVFGAVGTPPLAPLGKENQVTEELKIYASLSRIGFPKSYQGKIILVVFLGTGVPLIALVLYLLLSSPISLRPALHILALLLVATLIGTVVTLYAMYGLLAPIRLTSHSLREYLDSNRVPNLPIGFTDGAGRLMADVQYAVEHLDTTIRSLEGLSGTDPLTGLLNRRAGEKRLAEDAARVRRGPTTLTIGVVDVNNFKSINDTYGHQAGDVCIRHVADVIRCNIRESDWLARWGGDEFVLALHDASPFAATELVLQRIVTDLKDSPVRVSQGDELALTITIGASRYSGEADLRDLVAKADEALYEAKREERSWILSR